MRFLRAEIYGFGKWVDATFDFSKNNFICFYGENESGKSTLQQFILYILFGLLPRNRTINKPKNSNRTGGRLTIEDEKNGIYTIERIENKVTCFLLDGKKEDEVWLSNQLKGLTREVYDAIYAFSALDLTAIRSMNTKDLSNVLFSVGLTGATNIYQVEKQLENKIGQLFKKTGRKPIINQNIKQVNESYTHLMKAKANESKYREIQEQKEILTEKLMRLQAELHNLQGELLHHEKLQHIIPLLNEYNQLTEKLSSFREELSFPEDGVTRYQTLKTDLLPVTSEYNSIINTISYYEDKIAKVSASLYSEQIYQFAESIIAEKEANESILRQIKEYENKLKQTNELINEQLHHVGLQRTEIAEIILPFHLESTWKEISDLDQEIKRDNLTLAEDLQVINEETNRLKNEREEILKIKLPEKELIRIKETLKTDESYQTEKLHYEQEQEKWLKWRKKRTKTAKLTFVTTILLSITSLVFGLFLTNNQLYTLSIFFLLGGIVQFIYVKKSVKELQISTKPNPMQRQLTDVERNEYQLVIEEQEQLQIDLQMIEKELKRLNYHRLQWEERKRLFTQRKNNWLDRLETEKFQYPFLTAIDPAHWIELLRIIQQVKEYLYKEKQYKEKIAELTNKREKFKTKLTTFAREIGKESISLLEIEKIMEEGRSNWNVKNEYKKIWKDNMEKRNEITERINVYEDEIKVLFNIAKVNDEEAYMKVAKNIAEKESIVSDRLKIEEQVRSLFPVTDANDLFTKEINMSDNELTIIQLQDNIKSNQEVTAISQKQLASVELEIESMEMSDDYSKSAFIFQVEQDNLNDNAKEWAILKIAEATLKQAKNAYQEKHLSEVMSYTSAYFSQLTNGKYKQVFAPTTAAPFKVEGNNYIRYTVNELSQGTIDQLYVSLRLAISKVMSDKFIVPLMIDDAFVHFDDQRTSEVIHLLKQISEEQQILLFTCKKDIANKLESVHIVSDVKVSS